MATESITYDDVLLMPAYNHWGSRQVVDISMTDRTNKLSLKVPVMSSNMDTITESAMANFMQDKGCIGVLHRFMSVDKNVEEFKKCQGIAFVSVGCGESALTRAEALKDAGATYFCLDVAHAHARHVGHTLKQLRELLGPSSCIMAGNVATYAGADFLSSCGADIIKVGIGGGSVCTTRLKTGFGVPNLSAIKASSRVDRSIVADGGIRYAGDIVKALAFGADFVMLGSMLAGTTPTPGEIITETNKMGETKMFKSYRGMASKEVADDYHGGLSEWKTAEGVATKVPYHQTEEQILGDIIGGLRSGLTYGGAENIKALQRKLDYIKISPASHAESLPHKLQR